MTVVSHHMSDCNIGSKDDGSGVDEGLAVGFAQNKKGVKCFKCGKRGHDCANECQEDKDEDEKEDEMDQRSASNNTIGWSGQA